MGEMVQVNIRVNESQKERWENYVEDTGEFETLTNLIRSGVEREIKRDDVGEMGSSPAVGNDIQEIKDKLKTIRQDVGWLRRQEEEEEDISGFAQDVLKELEQLPEPTEPVEVPESVDMDLEEYRHWTGAQMVIEPSDADGDRYPQRIEDIAERLGEREDRVEDAIEHLQDRLIPLIEVEYQGEAHWFKEE